MADAVNIAAHMNEALRSARFILRSKAGGRYSQPVGWGEQAQAMFAHHLLWLYAYTETGTEIMRWRVGSMAAGQSINTAITVTVGN